MTGDCRARIVNLRDSIIAVANGVASRGIVAHEAGSEFADGYESAMRDVAEGISRGLLMDPTDTAEGGESNE